MKNDGLEEVPAAVRTGLSELFPWLVPPVPAAARTGLEPSPVPAPTNHDFWKPFFAAPADEAEASVQALFPPVVLASSRVDYASHKRMVGNMLTRREQDVLRAYRQKMRARVIEHQWRGARKRARVAIRREIKALEASNDSLRARIAVLEGSAKTRTR